MPELWLRVVNDVQPPETGDGSGDGDGYAAPEDCDDHDPQVPYCSGSSPPSARVQGCR